MGTVFRPMKGEGLEPADMAGLKFPLYAAPKLDGFRTVSKTGIAFTSAMKLHGNLFVQKYFSEHQEALEGLDGELVVGDPWDPTVFERTSGAIRRADGEPDFTFWVFDRIDQPTTEFFHRYASLTHLAHPLHELARVQVVKHVVIRSVEELDAYEQEMLLLGYEGVMLRSLTGPYKWGKSTVKEGWLMKLKRRQDAEARIVGYYEEQFNGNEAETDAFGRTKRSSHAENKVGKGTLGGFHVVGVNGQFAGVEFDVGTGYKGVERRLLWVEREAQVGRYITYKYLPVGSQEKPRHPIYKSFRDEGEFDIAA